MKQSDLTAEERRRRQARRALRRSRDHLSNPEAKLTRLLTAYAQLQARGKTRWSLPEA